MKNTRHLAFGLAGLADWQPQQPFLDYLKMARGWSAVQDGARIKHEDIETLDILDADGWPTRIPANVEKIYTLYDWNGADAETAATRVGRYVFTYEGAGTVRITGRASYVSAEPGRVVFDNPTGGTFGIEISETDPDGTGDHIRGGRLVREEQEALADTGAIFNPDWLALLKGAAGLRFMVWQSMNGTTQSAWSDMPTPGHFSWSIANKGVPVEVMVALANEVGADPHFCMPLHATEEFVRNFASYVRDNLDPRLVSSFEFSNETWNWGMVQTHDIQDMMTADWGSEGDHANYRAKLATRTAALIREVFGTRPHRNVLGVQTVNAWVTRQMLLAEGWKGIEPEAWIDPAAVFDAIAATSYFGSKLLGDDDLRGELLGVVTGGGDAPGWMVGKMLDPDCPNSIPQIAAFLGDQKAVAAEFGLALVLYEGGSHLHHWPKLTGTKDEKAAKQAQLDQLQPFLSDFSYSDSMAELYRVLWQAWDEVGDGPFMQYVECTGSSAYGSFGSRRNMNDITPRWTVLMDGMTPRVLGEPEPIPEPQPDPEPTPEPQPSPEMMTFGFTIEVAVALPAGASPPSINVTALPSDNAAG